jgi:hypothetical protein
MIARTIAMLAVAVTTLPAGAALAQVTPAAGFPPPDDNPSVRIGGVLFGDYTRTLEPEVADGDGNRVEAHSFNVMRAYLNVTGQVNHLIAFRITLDAALSEAARSRALAADGGVHAVGPHRWPEARSGSRLRAAAAGDRRTRDDRAGHDQDGEGRE